MNTELEHAKAELAPTGVLRVGVNLGNPLLTARGEAGADPTGVAVDLGRELARRLGVPARIVRYESPGQMAEDVTTGAWDVAFLAFDPERARDIEFAPSYVHIEATYLVRAEATFRTVADIDQPGVRVSVSAKSGYDPFLSRTLKHAQLERGKGIPGAIQIFVDGKADAVAALKPVLVAEKEKLPGTRLVEGAFTAVEQAIGMRKGGRAGARYVSRFVADVIQEGLVEAAIKRHSKDGLTVAPKPHAQA